MDQVYIICHSVFNSNWIDTSPAGPPDSVNKFYTVAIDSKCRGRATQVSDIRTLPTTRQDIKAFAALVFTPHFYLIDSRALS